MLYVRFPLSLRNVEDLLSEQGYRSQPINGYQILRTLFFNELGPREGSTAVAFPPAILSERLAQRCRYRRLRMHAAETDQTHQAILEIALAEYLKRTNA